MTKLEAVEVGHQAPDISDLVDKRFARFGLHPLTDEEVWALAMACMVMPDGNPGAEGYLAKVADTSLFDGRLAVWGGVVAIGIASASYRAKGGVRRRAYVEGYDESWGLYAVADGLSLAIDGTAPGLVERCESLGCGKQGYARIREFVGGAMVNAIAEYRTALEWALGYRRDRVFEGRWEGVTGLKWDDAKARDKMGYPEAGCSPMFAQGCARTVPLKDQADSYEEQPETLYHGLRPTGWWDEAYARRMRDAPIRMIYPATD